MGAPVCLHYNGDAYCDGVDLLPHISSIQGGNSNGFNSSSVGDGFGGGGGGCGGGGTAVSSSSSLLSTISPCTPDIGTPAAPSSAGNKSMRDLDVSAPLTGMKACAPMAKRSPVWTQLSVGSSFASLANTSPGVVDDGDVDQFSDFAGVAALSAEAFLSAIDTAMTPAKASYDGVKNMVRFE